MTDRSWGTREGKTASAASAPEMPWYEKLIEKFERLCVCCRRQPPQPQAEAIVIEDNMSDVDSIAGSLSNHSVDSAIITDSSITKQSEEMDSDDVLTDDADETNSLLSMDTKKVPPPVKPKSRRVKFASGLKFQSFKTANGQLRLQPLDALQRSVSIEQAATWDITDWLQGHYKQYVENFKDNGYDDTTFLVGLKEQDLLDIGITNRGHRKKLCNDIDQLPPEEIDQEVPDDVREWLIKLGLESYWESFNENSYTEPNALADLKFMNKSTIQVTFGMAKEGHVKKLLKAVKQLQYPSAAERRIRRSRVEIEKSACFALENTNADEHRFWERLRRVCLLPEQAAFNSSGELKEHLEDLRDTSLVGLAVSNILWLTVMVALISQGKKLQIFNTNFLGLGFLFVYTLLVVLQFFTLLFHRAETWVHLLARTPFTPGQGMHLNWSFNDEDLPRDPTKEELLEMQRRISSKVSRKSHKSRKSRKSKRGDDAEAMRRRRRHMQYANYVDYDGSVAMSF